ncbi:hypothetical protein ACJ41O_000971 [Fusarium nematophilum]
MVETDTSHETPKVGALPLFTDLSHAWEIDHFNPSHYTTSVFYLGHNPTYETEKPYFFNIPADPAWSPKVQQTNVKYTRKRIAITNLRGHEDFFSLDKHGFQLGAFKSTVSYDEFSHMDTIASRFYPEVKQFLKAYTGATEVLPFDFQIRRRDPDLPAGSRGAPGKAQPFSAVHGDQTTNAAYRRLKHFHPEFAEKYANGRFMIVNVWKPLVGPVQDSPLAVCDYRTVKDEDRVPCDIIFPDYLGETYNFWPNPNHRFYYVEEQRDDEAWMIKCFDSATSQNPDVAQFTPHVSFPYVGRGGLNASPRQSIEVRTFIFFD